MKLRDSFEMQSILSWMAFPWLQRWRYFLYVTRTCKYTQGFHAYQKANIPFHRSKVQPPLKTLYFTDWLLTVYLVAWFSIISAIGHWSLIEQMCLQCCHAQPPAGTGEIVMNPMQVPPSELTSSESCELIFATKCWPKTNRLSGISSAKMGLFRISRELQFGVCNHGEPRESSHLSREGEYFYRRGKGSWRVIKTERL